MPSAPSCASSRIENGLYTLRAESLPREQEVVQRVRVEVGMVRDVVLREPQ